MQKNAPQRPFWIISHTHRLSKDGGSRIGYHCPECGLFYAEGNFTIESMTHVLGLVERKRCCGKDLPTPRTFETRGEASAFVHMLTLSGLPERATLIPKRALTAGHFNRELVRAQKEKVLH